MTWTLWNDQRPADLTKDTVLMWRTKHRRGHMIQYAGRVRKMHDGWKNADFLLPPCAHWDGYKHNIPADLQWSHVVPLWYLDLADGDRNINPRLMVVEDCRPLPCPFTGAIPRWESYGGWVGACPENHDTFRLSSYIARTEGSDPRKLVEVWNRRP